MFVILSRVISKDARILPTGKKKKNSKKKVNIIFTKLVSAEILAVMC